MTSRQQHSLCLLFAISAAVGCSPGKAPNIPPPLDTPTVSAPCSYSLDDTQVHDIHSATLQRDYQLFVSFPETYDKRPDHTYPVLFVTDADYGFPLIRSIARRVGDHGRGLEEFVLVGLSYAIGDTPEFSRRRDYTPNTHGDADAVSDMPGRPVMYGEAERYRQFIEGEVFPYVAAHFHADMTRKIYAGHSYGGLFGTYILLTTPRMFQSYIISSPSLWFDHKRLLTEARNYGSHHDHLHAKVFLDVGAFETLNPGSNDPRYNHKMDLVRDLQQLAGLLESQHYPDLQLQTTVFANEDHMTVFPLAITRGLQWALPPLTPSS
jgi:predicted alpha/beta superfamily hydrolase